MKDLHAEPKTVYVNFTQFPPYFDERGGVRSGMAVDLLEIMNAFQSEFHFKFFPSPPMRRFNLFDQGRYDLSFFDHLHWGWESRDVESTRVFLKGGEKYIAVMKPGRDQEYFDQLKGKRLGGYLGYHYGIANFKSDPEILRKEYNMSLSSSHEGNLNRVLKGRVDVAILTDAFISRWLLLNPDQRDKLLISDKWDQEYNFVVVVRKGIKPSASDLNELFDQMTQKGVLAPLWKKYGLPTSSYQFH